MNDETSGAKPVKTYTGTKIFAHASEHIGIVIQLTIIGFGCAAISHMITGTASGPRYWIASAMALGVYMLGAILELMGECGRKKERE